MKKKTVWLILSCLMVIALMLTSCAPAVTEEEEGAPPVEEKEVVTDEEEEAVTEQEEATPSPEKQEVVTEEEEEEEELAPPEEDQGTLEAGESDSEQATEAGPDYREFDGIYVLFKPRDVAAYRELLPDVFDMPDTPLVKAVVVDYYKMDPSFIEPYLEGIIYLLAEYEGQRYWHCISMPVTSEAARWGGVYYFGYPKVIGDISLERDDPNYTGTVKLEGITVMTISLATEGHVITEEEEQWFQYLTGITDMNILRGRIIIPVPDVAKQKTSLLQWSEMYPDFLPLKVGKAELSLRSGATEEHSGKEYYAFGIEPDEIVLAYYHVNKFGFSFGDVEWR